MICSPMSFYVKYAGMVSNMYGGYTTDWDEFIFVIFLIFILLGIWGI